MRTVFRLTAVVVSAAVLGASSVVGPAVRSGHTLSAVSQPPFRPGFQRLTYEERPDGEIFRAAGLRLEELGAGIRGTDGAVGQWAETWRVDAGWPFLATTCVVSITSSGDRLADAGVFVGPPLGPAPAEFVQALISGPRVIPLRPRPAGLAGNLALATALAAAAVFGPPRIRAAVRRRRGLCPGCGHPRGPAPAAAPCSECGASPA